MLLHVRTVVDRQGFAQLGRRRWRPRKRHARLLLFKGRQRPMVFFHLLLVRGGLDECRADGVHWG